MPRRRCAMWLTRLPCVPEVTKTAASLASSSAARSSSRMTVGAAPETSSPAFARRSGRLARRGGWRDAVLDAQAEQVDRSDGRLDEAATDPLGDEERVDRVAERHDGRPFGGGGA